MSGGFLAEALRFKDWYFDQLFAFKGVPETFSPLRKIEDADRVPDVFQGNSKGCVPCAISWIAMYSRPGSIVPWQEIAKECGTDDQGTRPSTVLNFVQKAGLIPNYAILKDKSPASIYKALHVFPLVIGVENLPMVPEPHFMVLWDVTEDGKNWRCFTWDKENGQGYLELSTDYPIIYAATFFRANGNAVAAPRHGFSDVIADKLSFYAKKVAQAVA